MNLVFHIARKEWREIARSGLFRIGGSILLLLLLMSLYTSFGYYQRMSRQQAEAQQVARTQWESQEAKNPHSAAHYGTYAFKPWSPLSLVDQGLNRYLGVSVFLEAHRQHFATYKAIEDSHSLARFGALTPSFVLVYLGPLLLILLAFDRMSRERRAGTLRLQLSQGASLRQVLLGKWLALMGVAGGLLLLFLLGGLFFLLNANGQGEDYLRLGLMGLAFALYFAAFIQIALLISTRSRSGNLSLVASLAVWIVSCLVMPRASVHLANRLYPSPTLEQFQEAVQRDLDQGIDGHDPYDEFAQAFKDSVLQAHGVETVEELPFNYSGLVMQAGEEHETFVYDRHLTRLRNLHQDQLAVQRALSALSPSWLASSLSMGLARTDMESHYHFTQAAESYRIELVRDLNYDLKDNSRYGDWGYRVSEDFFASNVRFDYAPLAWKESRDLLAGSFLGLLLWWLLSGLGLLAGGWRLSLV